MSALLIDTYGMTYQTFPISIRCWRSYDSDENCSQSTSYGGTTKESAVFDTEIPLRMLYNKLIKTGNGRRHGIKADISLLSAFENLDQIYVMLTSEDRYGDTVYCRYFDQQREEIGPAFKAVVFPEYTANCLRREGNDSYEFPVPIIDHTQNVTTHYFSACVAPLYGTEPKWLLLAEFIEHHKIQGATYFYIYLREIDDYSKKLLDDYVRTGEAISALIV